MEKQNNEKTNMITILANASIRALTIPLEQILGFAEVRECTKNDFTRYDIKESKLLYNVE